MINSLPVPVEKDHSARNFSRTRATFALQCLHLVLGVASKKTPQPPRYPLPPRPPPHCRSVGLCYWPPSPASTTSPRLSQPLSVHGHLFRLSLPFLPPPVSLRHISNDSSEVKNNCRSKLTAGTAFHAAAAAATTCACTATRVIPRPHLHLLLPWSSSCHSSTSSTSPPTSAIHPSCSISSLHKLRRHDSRVVHWIPEHLCAQIVTNHRTIKFVQFIGFQGLASAATTPDKARDKAGQEHM